MAQGDANLLFGIFAVQLQLVTPQQLAGAGAVWATDQTRRLSDILVEQGVLSDQDRSLIGQLIERQVQAAGGDESRVYRAFGGDHAAQRSFGGSLVFDKPEPGRARYVSFAPFSESQATPIHSDGELGALPQAISDSLPPEQPGRYELRSEQGRGGIGRVLLAYDSAIGREIALKELIRANPAEGSTGPGARTSAQTVRFLREARITGQLEHPGIVPVYELGRREDGTVYYTMKLVRGETMADQLQAAHGLSARLGLLHHFVDLCQAIAYAHSRGVIHRDIKPANVMVGEFGETLLLDWGLAKVKGQKDEGAEKLADEVRLLKEAGVGESFVGRPIGTPSYMPPEQADGRIQDIDERSDVWSLGAVLYEILTGKPPFTGANAFEVIGSVLGDEVEPVSEVNQYAPAELAAIAMLCLERDPARRYQSVEKLADDVKAFQSGGLVSAYSYNTALMLRRWAARHRVELATAAVGLFLLLALGVFSYGKVLEQRNAAVNALARLDKRNNELLGLQLATQSREQLAAGRSERATLLALEAARFYSQSDSWMPEIDRSLRDCAGAPYFGHLREYFDTNQDGVIFLKDNRSLASVGGAGAVIWDLSRPEALPTILPQAAERIAASPDGKWLATGRNPSEDTYDPKSPGVLIWDTQNLQAQPRLLADSVSDIRSLAFSADSKLLAAGGEDSLVRVWQVNDLDKPAVVLRGHQQKVMSLAFSPDGRWLASTSADATIRLWHRGDLSIAPTLLEGHLDQVYCAVFTPDSRTLITCAQDDTVRFWNVSQLAARGSSTQPPDRSLVEANVMEVHADFDDIISGVALTPDGKQLAVACYDERVIRLYQVGAIRRAFADEELKAGKPRAPGTSNAQALDQLEVAKHRAYVPPLALLRGHEDGIDTVAFSNDGGMVASGAHDHTTRIWELAPPRPEPVELPGQQQAMAVAASDDGKLVAGAGDNPSLVLWDLDQSESQPRTLLRIAETIRVVSISPDRHWLAAGGFDSLVRLWDLTQPDAKPRVLQDMGTFVRALDFSPDGKWLAAGAENLICIFRLDGPDKPPLRLDKFAGQARGIAFSPDSKLLAVSSGEVFIYSLSDLSEPVKVMNDHQAAVTAVCFSQDGRFLASSSWDGTARLWEVDQPGSTSKVFKANDGWLYAVALSPDGKYIAAGGKSNLVRIWDASRPDERPQVLLGFGGTVTGLAYSADGKRLFSSSVDGKLRIWLVDHDDLAQASRDRVWRNLTVQEWQTFIGRDRPYNLTLPKFPARTDVPDSTNL